MNSKPMNRRMIGAIAALAMTPLVLASCSGGGGGTSGGDVDSLSILDYYVNEPDNELVGAVLDSCATELGVTIERESVPGKDLIAKVLQQASSKTLPDVLMIDNPDVQEIAATGGLSPLSDYDVDTEGFAQGFLDAGTYEGEVYGIGPTANTIALFYNEDVLAAAGVEPPETWDELKDAAAALTSGSQYGLAFSGPNNYEGSWTLLPFIWSNGGTESDLTTPEVAEALQLWVDMVDAGSVSKSVINWTQADVKDQFVAGNAAMMINGPWQIPALDESGIDWGTVPIPVPDAGDTSIAPLGGEVWTVPVTGDVAKQAKAAEFIECISNDENQLSLAESRFTVPTRTSLAEQYVENVPDMAAFTELVAQARSRTGELGEDWPEAGAEIYTAIQLALTGQATPADAFTQAAQG